MAGPTVSLRAATAVDQDFLFRVFASTRDDLALVPWPPPMKEAFLRQQFAARTKDYEARFGNQGNAVVLCGEEPVGQLWVHRSDEEVRMLDVALLPEHRGAGVGTQLVTELLEEARDRRLPVRLQVLVGSPARRLYERLGFHPVGEAGVYQQMEHDA